MAKPFDATMKDLVDTYVRDYEAALELPGPLTPANVDLSVVSAATDIVLARGQPPSALVTLDFQAGWVDDLPARVHLYNAVAHYRKLVPVHSIVVLLRPIAHLDRLLQGVHYAVWPERGATHHQFEVVRLWEWPVERVLAGGLGTLPLAPLCWPSARGKLEVALPGILRTIDERLTREAPAADATKLWTATFLLTGLRTTPEHVLPLFQGVHGMKESTTYQYILDEGAALGAVNEARKLLLRLGQKKFGPPGPAVAEILEAVNDLDQLERLSDRILEAASWQNLLETA